MRILDCFEILKEELGDVDETQTEMTEILDHVCALDIRGHFAACQEASMLPISQTTSICNDYW